MNSTTLAQMAAHVRHVGRRDLLGIPIVLVLAAVNTIGQTVSVQPLQVIDLRSKVISHTGREDFEFSGIAQNLGRWAALVGFQSLKEHAIVTGDDKEVRVSGVIDSFADRIAIDASGSIYTRVKARASRGSAIEVRDWSLESAVRFIPNEQGAEPVPSGPDVLWRRGYSGDKIWRLQSKKIKGELSDESDQPFWMPPEIKYQVRFVFGMVSKKWMQVETLSEQVEVRDTSGRLITKKTINLDEAYRMAGQAIPNHSPMSGVSRMLWVAASQQGALVICLSSLPISKPAYLAVINPSSGDIMRVIEAQLPVSPRRIDEFNPLGLIYPIKGAVSDRIVILDSQLGILAVYELN